MTGHRLNQSNQSSVDCITLNSTTSAKAHQSFIEENFSTENNCKYIC